MVRWISGGCAVEARGGRASSAATRASGGPTASSIAVRVLATISALSVATSFLVRIDGQGVNLGVQGVGLGAQSRQGYALEKGNSQFPQLLLLSSFRMKFEDGSGQEQGTKSGHRPANGPLINQLSAANQPLVVSPPHSVYIGLFVLPKNRSARLSLVPWKSKAKSHALYRLLSRLASVPPCIDPPVAATVTRRAPPSSVHGVSGFRFRQMFLLKHVDLRFAHASQRT